LILRQSVPMLCGFHRSLATSPSQHIHRHTRSQPAFGLRCQPELSQQAVMISPLRTASPALPTQSA
jgi:hypothetical protein